MAYIVIEGLLPEITQAKVGEFLKIQESAKDFNWTKYGKVYEDIIPAAAMLAENGIRALSIMKVTDGKLDDAMKLLTEWSLRWVFAGAKYRFNVYYDLAELIGMAGIPVPK